MKRILLTAAALVLALATSQAVQAGQRTSRPHTNRERYTNSSRRYDDYKHFDHSRYHTPWYCEPCDEEPSYCEPCYEEPCESESYECESFECEPSYRESYRRPSFRYDDCDRDGHYDRDGRDRDRGRTSHLKTRSRGN